MAKAEVVAAYKKLSLIETAFRNLKTVQLEVRPVYHKLDDRIRAHVFLCTLAYYLQWHLTQRLQRLFAADGRHKHRQWSLKSVLHRLQAIRREKVSLGGVEFKQVTVPEADQLEILKLLQVRIL
jgi:transposase